MRDQEPPNPEQEAKEFASEAERENAGLMREIWDLIRFNKKWWLLPIIAILLAIGVLVFLGTTALAPFIYPLF